MSRDAVHRGQLEDAQDDRRGGGVPPGAAAARLDGRRRRRRALRPFTALQAARRVARGSRVEVYAQNMHQAAEGAFTGEISRRDAHRDRRATASSSGHSERRQYFCETDRALAEKVAAALDAGCARDPLRRRDRGGARARRDRAQAAPPGPGGPARSSRRAARRDRHRLRADLGDRHRPRRHARAGAGGDRVRPRAGRRPRPRAGRAHAHPLRRQREAGQRRRAARRCPTSTARWSAARRSTSTRSPRSSRPRSGRRALVTPSLRGAGHPRRLGPAPPGPGNAVSLADTPVFDDLWARYPHTQLTACGRAVGLPEGQMGNSEVGHLNLGAGAVVKQDLDADRRGRRGGTLADNAVLRRRSRAPSASTSSASSPTAACTRARSTCAR